MEQVTRVPDLEGRLAGWKEEVNQVRTVLRGMNQRLENEAGRFSSRPLLVHVEHFQNQFICQKEVADELFHDLKQASRRHSATDPGAEAQGALTDRVETFSRLFKALSLEFDQFMKKPS